MQKKHYIINVTLKRRLGTKMYAIGNDEVTVTAKNDAEARRKAKAKFARLVFKENMLATDIIQKTEILD